MHYMSNTLGQSASDIEYMQIYKKIFLVTQGDVLGCKIFVFDQFLVIFNYDQLGK